MVTSQTDFGIGCLFFTRMKYCFCKFPLSLSQRHRVEVIDLCSTLFLHISQSSTHFCLPLTGCKGQLSRALSQDDPITPPRLTITVLHESFSEPSPECYDAPPTPCHWSYFIISSFTLTPTPPRFHVFPSWLGNTGVTRAPQRHLPPPRRAQDKVNISLLRPLGCGQTWRDEQGEAADLPRGSFETEN